MPAVPASAGSAGAATATRRPVGTGVLSVKTIGYYDRIGVIGVLCPQEGSEAGYRLYGEDALRPNFT